MKTKYLPSHCILFSPLPSFCLVFSEWAFTSLVKVPFWARHSSRTVATVIFPRILFPFCSSSAGFVFDLVFWYLGGVYLVANGQALIACSNINKSEKIASCVSPYNRGKPETHSSTSTNLNCELSAEKSETCRLNVCRALAALAEALGFASSMCVCSSQLPVTLFPDTLTSSTSTAPVHTWCTYIYLCEHRFT